MEKISRQESKVSDYTAELRAKEKNDLVGVFLGMKVVELSPGYARVTMKLKPEYLNSIGLIFGGIIIAVADQAFAYASNSLAHPSLASQFNTHFIAAPAVDDELIAEGRVVSSGRRVGVSEIVVTNQEGKLIAKSTGTTIPVG